jgi:hypothetical protein
VLEQDGCVSHVADVGVECISSGNCQNYIHLIDTPVDVVDSFHCTHNVFQSPINREDVMGMAPPSSNGITINEPDPLHTRASYPFRQASLDASVNKKGTRKMDDMSSAPSTGMLMHFFYRLLF